MPLLAAACTAAAVGAGAARGAPSLSSNWAGYAAIGLGSTASTASPDTRFTDVTGEWVQPRASCTPGTPTSVAIWVGLGGYSIRSRALEQVGTSADCDATGHASYTVWYELIPADSVRVSLRVRPGDRVVGVVEATGNGVLVQFIDRTRGRRFTRRLAMASPDLSSAEWIVEAPSQCDVASCGNQLPLTNFGSIAFTRTFVTGNGDGGTISGPGWTSAALRLVPRTTRFYAQPNGGSPAAGAGATPSPLTPDGSGFTVAWQAAPTGSG